MCGEVACVCAAEFKQAEPTARNDAQMMAASELEEDERMTNVIEKPVSEMYGMIETCGRTQH